MPPCTALTGAPTGAPISMPLRWMVGAEGAGGRAPEAREHRPGDRPRQLALERAQRQVHDRVLAGGRPESVDWSRVGPAPARRRTAAASSRRRSNSSSSRVRSATARAAAASRLTASSRRRSSAALRTRAGRAPPAPRPAAGGARRRDLLDPGQRHDAAAGAGEVALVAGVEQQPDVAVAPPLVERLEPLFERRRTFDPLPLERLDARRRGLDLGGDAVSLALTAASSSTRRSRGSARAAAAPPASTSIAGELVGLALQRGDALAGAPHQSRRVDRGAARWARAGRRSARLRSRPAAGRAVRARRPIGGTRDGAGATRGRHGLIG